MPQELRRALERIKNALQPEPVRTIEELNQQSQLLPLLSEAILERGRMWFGYLGYSGSVLVVEIEELANCFRESPQTVREALLLLERSGCAEPTNRREFWKLRVARIPPVSREGARMANNFQKDTEIQTESVLDEKKRF
jgi:hypothetical protein